MTKNQGLFKALLFPHLLYFLLLICNTTQGLCADNNLLGSRKSECIRIPRPGKKIDFAFVIDSTGSMSGEIYSVKNNARRLIDEKLMSKSGNMVAVTSFEDYCDGPKLFVKHCGFTSSAATAKSAINEITIGNGGDTAEAHWTALYRARHELDWRSGTRKAVALMTDAPPHPKGEGGEKHSEREVINLLKRAGIEQTSLSLKEIRLNAAKAGESGDIGGISVYPILSYNSVAIYYTNLAVETEGEIVLASDYNDMAEAFEDLIDAVTYPNGFETEIVSVNRGEESVTVNVYGGNRKAASSVRYQVVSGSAINGRDFSTDSGEQVLEWEEGEKDYKEITIPLLNSPSKETAFFSIILFSPQNMGLPGITVCRINLLGDEPKKKRVFIQVLPENPSCGTVSGAGSYSLKRKAKISASANQDYVFTSWDDENQDNIRKINTTEAYNNAIDGVMTYIASFIHIDELPLPTIKDYETINAHVNSPFGFSLEYQSISKATIMCEGLPPGLKCNDSGIISGTVKDAGTWAVTFRVRNAKGMVSKIVYFNFEGGADPSKYFGCLTDENKKDSGTVSLKVGNANRKAGKIKVAISLKTISDCPIKIKGLLDPITGEIDIVSKKEISLKLRLKDGSLTGEYNDLSISPKISD